jgi:predicted dithiol-disulfide oxidoreductase (DUF899 family)
LIIYHFMYGADWDEGCPSCSFWADVYDRIAVHLNARDVSLAAISTASLEKLEAYKKRLGWSFKWLSVAGNRFNQDFHVSFSEEELAKDAPNYNFGTKRFNGPEAPGMSVFVKDADGTIYHTYSAYARAGSICLTRPINILTPCPKAGTKTDCLTRWLGCAETILIRCYATCL